MSPRFVVSGTDTDVGKTVFCAALAGALGATYWKPIQSGLATGTDSARVATLGGLPADRILPERYRLAEPLSPHRAAELDGIRIDVAALEPPDVEGPLIIEGAGGLMVPITRQVLQIELFQRWQIPVILVARTALGTINHTLLSVAALRARSVPLHGVAFVGDANADTERTITDMAGVRRLGRLNRVDPLERTSLARAFADGFRIEEFAA